MKKTENTNKLGRIVIHYLEKEQHSRDVKPDYATALASSSDENTKIFFDNFIKVINKTSKEFTYNSFLEKNPNKKYVSDIIEEYPNKTKTDEEFLKVSKDIAVLFKDCLSNASASTGGQMIIFDYTTASGKQKLAITLMNTESTTATKDHSFISGVSLNMNHMALAAIINISRWTNKAEFTANPNVVQFIAGEREISKYYREDFIGCAWKSNSKIHTETLMNALNGFMTGIKKKTPQEWYSVRSRACEYMESNPQETILKNLLNCIMEDEDDQKEFIAYCEENDYELSASFKPNKQVLKNWKKLIYNTKGIKVEIEPEKLKDGSTAYIAASEKEKGYLKIFDTDGEIAKKLANLNE